MNARAIVITVTWRRLVVIQKVHLPVAVTTDTPEMASNVQVCSLHIDLTVQDVGKIWLDNYKLPGLKLKPLESIHSLFAINEIKQTQKQP